MLAHRHHIRQSLRRMKFVGQAVPYGHARVFRQRMHDTLGEPSVFDPVVHASQHPGRIFDGLLLAYLRAGRPQIGHSRALIVSGHFERTSRTGRILLEQQHDVLALQRLSFPTGILVVLQPNGQLQQIPDLFGGEIEQGQQTSLAQINHSL